MEASVSWSVSPGALDLADILGGKLYGSISHERRVDYGIHEPTMVELLSRESTPPDVLQRSVGRIVVDPDTSANRHVRIFRKPGRVRCPFKRRDRWWLSFSWFSFFSRNDARDLVWSPENHTALCQLFRRLNRNLTVHSLWQVGHVHLVSH